MRRFYTLYELKYSNLRPLLSITFPQGFRKSKKFGHLTSGSGGKKTANVEKKTANVTNKTVIVVTKTVNVVNKTINVVYKTLKVAKRL